MKKNSIKSYLILALSITTIMNGGTIKALAADDYKVIDKTNSKYVQYLERNKDGQAFKDGVIVTPYKFNASKVITPFRRGLEAKYDPRGEVTTPVKNQMNLGTCWDFAATANLEHHLVKQDNQVNDFSEEHMRWWAMKDSQGNGWQRTDGDGGNPLISSGYFTSGDGPKSDKDIPYYGYKGGRKPSNFLTASVKKAVRDIIFVEGEKTTIKNAILKYGSVETGYHHDDSFYNSRNAAYYCGEPNLQPNHEVLVVGWDDNFSRSNFGTKPANDGAWLVKNSWGTSWGDSGYFWVSYEDKYFLNDEYNENVALGKVDNYNPDEKIYQHDPYGVINTYGLTKNDQQVKTLGFANVYDFSDGYNQLEKVMFMTESEGANYEISYAPYSDGTIQLDKKVSLATGVVPHVGYVTADINKYSLPTGKGAIIVNLDGEKANVVASIGDEESYDGVYVAKAAKGESYYIDGSKVTDINEGAAASKYKNLSIKAITTKTGNPNPNPNPNPDPVTSNTNLSMLKLGSTDVTSWIEGNTVEARINYYTSSIKVAATAEDSNAKIVSINGVSVNNNSGAVTVSLSRWYYEFNIPVVVKAADGTTKTYTVYLQRNYYY